MKEKKPKKNEDPTCACGRVDLYEESLRQKEIEQNAEAKKSVKKENYSENQ